jgi:hypothetical protein
MNTNNITQICSAVNMYTLTDPALSAAAVIPSNISTIYNEVSTTTMGAVASGYTNITLIAQTIAPFVSAM